MDPGPQHRSLRFESSGCGVFWLLLLAFTAVPLAELALLLEVHGAIGLGPTLALVFLTGTTGAALARWQGLKTLARIREATAQGQLPGQALFDGAAILVAGAMLVTPGVLTDAVGFLLLVPACRRLLAKGLRAWFARRLGPPGGGPGGGGEGGRPDIIIDAEVVSSRPVEPPPPARIDDGHSEEPE